jgi:hypothetical protein
MEDYPVSCISVAVIFSWGAIHTPHALLTAMMARVTVEISEFAYFRMHIPEPSAGEAAPSREPFPFPNDYQS